MPRKNRGSVKNSLTLRIFLITFALLLGASAVTYGVIALATPITYISIFTQDLESAGIELAVSLENLSLADSGPAIDAFIRDTGAGVLIVGEDGRMVETPSHLSIQVAYEDDSAVVAVAPAAEDLDSVTFRYGGALPGMAAKTSGPLEALLDLFHEKAVTAGVSSYSITTNSSSYPFSFLGETEVNTLYITPPVEKRNRALEALEETAPWLLLVMLAFSAVCARIYSRYITRPILRLSEISQRMAYLDFSWRCQETRGDEIGDLGRSLDELSGRLSAALTELKAANAALERDIRRERELDRQRAAFFSAASHELKTPVTILKGQLTGMLEGVGVYQDRDRYLARALQTAGRMEALVQELLTVSRMDSAALRRQEVDLGALAREQAGQAEDLLAGKRVALDLPEGLTVSGDPALLRKVLDNLLSNAAFYSPEGASVTISGGRTPDAVLLQVENGGVWIPEKALNHLFEAFYRVESSRSRRTGGSGLGLYIVKGILDLHHAVCFAENTRAGVRFSVRFPLPPEGAEDPAARSEKSP